jgi:hypothetical protein
MASKSVKVYLRPKSALIKRAGLEFDMGTDPKGGKSWILNGTMSHPIISQTCRYTCFLMLDEFSIRREQF